ncbi:bifunctional 4-hydroxy-2-oxoglutarate aldolase/2-dehydro-3-deoxy-phosphogluconate aldolase [Clostridiaceae bacterium Marseille-Q4145]|nr:bifunctional 4-hydroxy-2-oxoglutarate aldolase/2-dehydro-3-deoxy-phosphogluconate aldolase [Clostridiaceae bacterium Marseille-Q4145]
MKIEKIIAIARGISSNYILKTADALRKGGVHFMEVTYNPSDENASKDTLKSIEMLKKEFGEAMHIGAGTVLTAEQVKTARNAGAEYIISPNVEESVIQKTKELGLISIPGAMTPTEAQNAWKCGADYVKVFPAGNLGADYIRAMLSSMNHLKLVATGGIDEKNMLEFLNSGCVGFGIGGSLVNRKLAEAGNYQEIFERAEKMVKLLQRG